MNNVEPIRISDFWEPLPSLDKMEWLMGFAEHAAKRSPDLERKVGSALVKRDSQAVVATGFNGFARGAHDDSLPNSGDEKHNVMIHSEMNLIFNAAKHGISMQDCDVYCTLSPCPDCMRALWQCGVNRVFVKEQYKKFNQVLDMKDLKVFILDVENGYKVLNYYV